MIFVKPVMCGSQLLVAGLCAIPQTWNGIWTSSYGQAFF